MRQDNGKGERIIIIFTTYAVLEAGEVADREAVTARRRGHRRELGVALLGNKVEGRVHDSSGGGGLCLYK